MIRFFGYALIFFVVLTLAFFFLVSHGFSPFWAMLVALGVIVFIVIAEAE